MRNSAAINSHKRFLKQETKRLQKRMAELLDLMDRKPETETKSKRG